MRNNNYYEVLGLKPTCTPHEIKKSYRQLALIWHPDKHNNKKEAQVKFTSINEAYNTLIDSNKRQIYDIYGHDGLNSENLGHKKNYFEKGFCGTDKSAFDVLRDIFQDNDGEDDFYKDFNLSGMCNTMKANMQSFVYEHIISSDDEDEIEEDNFFTSYMPTFMNAAFNSTLSSLNEIYSGEGSSTQFLSSFFADLNDNEAVPKSAKKKSKKGKNIEVVIEDDIEYETLHKKSSKAGHPSNTRKTKASKTEYPDGSFLQEDESFEEGFHIEFNVTNKRRKLSFSLDIVSGSNIGTPKKRDNSSKKSIEKIKGGRKKVKK